MAEPTPTAARWLHAWAVLTVLATLPLLFLGAEVTTKQVGMADPVWPTAPWYLFGISWVDQGIGFLIEHGHRLAGYTVGTCAIVLVLSLWCWESRRWVRWLGVAALLGIIVQGVLGGLRVRLNALLGPDLALVHGCFGQIVFATLVSLAIVTARRWRAAELAPFSREPEASAPQPCIENAITALAPPRPVKSGPANVGALRTWSLVVVALVVTQLILGAILRHKGAPFSQRAHVLMAFAITFAVGWLARLVWTQHGSLPLGVKVLLVLLGLQVMLGIEAWMVRFMTPTGMPPGHWLLNRDLVRSLHVLVGSFLLANAVVVALHAHRGLVTRWVQLPVPGHLEGAA